MVYALRHYQKGVKGSGTKDLWVGEVIPTRDEVAQHYGSDGKYIVMERGKGIRGMRKIAEYIFNEPLVNTKYTSKKSEWMPKVFAAEHEGSMSVKKEISDSDLNGLWDSMLETPVDSDEDFQRFVDDNSKLKKEVYNRLKNKEAVDIEGVDDSNNMAAENNSGKFGYGSIVTAGVVGLVAGAVLQEVRWKRRFDEADEKMKGLEELIEALTEKASQAAESKTFASSHAPLSNHNILRSFNQRTGY